MTETPTKEQELRAALLSLLDHVDYTAGACRVNEPIGGVLPAAAIERAKRALANEPEVSDADISAWWRWSDSYEAAAVDMLHARGHASAIAPDGPTPAQIAEAKRRIAAALAGRRS